MAHLIPVAEPAAAGHPYDSLTVHVRVPERSFMFVRYILEGYDGLGYATTVGPDRLRITFCRSSLIEMEAVLEAIGEHTGLVIDYEQMATPVAGGAQAEADSGTEPTGAL